MPKKETTRWLMVRLGHFGDVLLTTGVLRHFGQTRGITFDVLTKNQWAEVFTNHPQVGTVYAATEENLASGQWASFLRGVMAMSPEGCGLLDLHGVLRTRLMRLAWPWPVAAYPKMGLARRVFQASRCCGESLRRLSVPQRYALALDSAVTPEPLLVPQLWLDASELAHGAAALLSVGLDPVTRPVALHPFATHATKAWPEGHWERLAAFLEEESVPFVLVGKGGSGSKVPAGPSLIDTCTLRQSAAVLAHCRALVTGDSGPLHLARAVGTPVLALFGPTTREWGFFPTPAEGRVLELPLPCRPCSLHGKKPCAHEHRCLAAITPEEVRDALFQM